ncbi:MAG: hypothetical protein LH471_04745 [Salinibacterium sp.]|nr:hypothetical protein [Salinibacterium sp.]
MSAAVSRFDSKAKSRALIAPVNYSGQATSWARALEREYATVSATSMAVEVPGGFSYPADLVVPVATYHNDKSWQRAQSSAVREQASHVLVEAEEPPFGRLLARSVEAQVEVLLRSGVVVGFMGHGTDVRVPSRHRESTRWSPYWDEGVYAPRLETLARRNIDLIERSGLASFVSTPDLLSDLPNATWCPVVVEPEKWNRTRPNSTLSSPRLSVVHAPSNPVLKGTALIAPAVEVLRQRNVIDFTRVSGIPASRMPDAYASADVMLDQFRIGSYGVAACEAMASGCVVVGHILPSVRETVLRVTGLELPIVEATPDTLGSTLAALARDPARRASIAEAGQDFVRTAHDGRLSAQVLREKWLNEPDQDRSGF